MNQSEFKRHFDDLVAKLDSTMNSKGNDYSIGDRLSNFKQVGAITNLSPAKVALVLAAVKISRMCALLDQGRNPQNESVQDTALDLTAYGILTSALLNEAVYAQEENLDLNRKESI